MLRAILHWVYCLPLEQAVLLALMATGLFLWLRRKAERYRWWKVLVVAALVCWAGVVAVDTLLNRSGSGRQLSLIPLQSYITVLRGGEKELIRSSFMNVLLFYPAGLLILSGWPRWRIGLLIMAFFTLSLAIEVCQYALSLGLAETDDVIHNTLGALLGMLAARQYEKLQRADP